LEAGLRAVLMGAAARAGAELQSKRTNAAKHVRVIGERHIAVRYSQWPRAEVKGG
jgi:hypothetical protein